MGPKFDPAELKVGKCSFSNAYAYLTPTSLNDN